MAAATSLAGAGPPAAPPAGAATQPATRPATQPTGAGGTNAPRKGGGGGGDELMMFADVPVVVSASRSAQPLNWLSVPVSIITDQDIHYSGVTNIPDILQYVPGVDVLRVDRTRYAVGVRGMHDTIADRTLTLVDGRAADSPIFGGSEFYRLPVFMEDIKRIEVVRGPGGAAWGANAFTGVINIITKEPEDCLGVLASTTLTDFGDTYNHVRWAAKEGKWSWMASVGYNSAGSSEQAMGEPNFATMAPPALQALMGYDGYEARDLSRFGAFDAKAIYRPEKQSKLSFGLGASQFVSGDYELGGYFPPDDVRLCTYRPFVRFDRTFADGSSGYLQWFSKIERSNMPSAIVYQSMENDLEAQYTFRPAEKHQTTVGGNLRWINMETDTSGQQYFISDHPFNEFWGGLFGIDRWDLTDRLVLESQLRGDWYSQTQTDWSARESLMYALDAGKRHVVRLSGAKAFRAPLASLRDSQGGTLGPLPSPPLPPGLFAVNLLRAEDLENEETVSAELGYTGKLTDILTVGANLYYQRFDRVIGYKMIPDPLGIGRGIGQADNIAGADAYGAEFEAALENKTGKLSAWYAMNLAETDEFQQNTRSYLPAKHKAGLTGRLFLPRDITLNANYRFTSVTPSAYIVPADSSHQLDLTVSKAVLKGAGEVMLGVSDVLSNERGPNYSFGGLTAHETPGRTFFLRFQVRF